MAKVFFGKVHADEVTRALFYYMNSMKVNSLHLTAAKQVWKLWTEATERGGRFCVEVEVEDLGRGEGDLVIKR